MPSQQSSTQQAGPERHYYVVCEQLRFAGGPYTESEAERFVEHWNSRQKVLAEQATPGTCYSDHKVMDHNPYSGDDPQHEGG